MRYLHKSSEVCLITTWAADLESAFTDPTSVGEMAACDLELCFSSHDLFFDSFSFRNDSFCFVYTLIIQISAHSNCRERPRVELALVLDSLGANVRARDPNDHTPISEADVVTVSTSLRFTKPGLLTARRECDTERCKSSRLAERSSYLTMIS